MKVAIVTHQFTDGEGISEYSKSLAEKIVEEGGEAFIVSFEDGSNYSIDERVEVVRVPLHFEGDNIYNWAMVLNNELKREVSRIEEEHGLDVLHCNDWTTVPAGISVSSHSGVPLVLTLHSTENERGFTGDHSGMISELEWKGVQEADKVLVTKEDTGNSVLFDLEAEEGRVETVDPYSGDWTSQVADVYRSVSVDEAEVVEP